MSDVYTTLLDPYGRAAWGRDSLNPTAGSADGYISYLAYDPATEAVTKPITEVDTGLTGDFDTPSGLLLLAYGWTSGGLPGPRLRLTTQTAVDRLGRTTKRTDGAPGSAPTTAGRRTPTPPATARPTTWCRSASTSMTTTASAAAT